jgi:hypothetical protein
MKKKKAPRKVAAVARAALVAARDYLQGIEKEDSEARPLPACIGGDQLEAMSETKRDVVWAEQLAQFQRRAREPRPDLSMLKTGIPALDRALPWVTLGADRGKDETEPQTGSIRHAVLLARQMIQLHDDATSGLPADFAKRLRKVERARKCLHEASQLLKEAGADHLSALASNLAEVAGLARGADVRVRPFDPETGKIGDAERIGLTGFAHHDKMPPNVALWHAKETGRATNAKAAANGAAVRALGYFIRSDAPQRAPIIAGLCQVLGYDVKSQAVAQILDPATPNPPAVKEQKGSTLSALLSQNWKAQNV